MDYKQRIKDTLSPHIKYTTGKDYTDKQWEDYFLTEYTPCEFIYEKEDFFSYKRAIDYIWIQDFCSTNIRNAYKLLEKMIDFGVPLKCQVSITNVKILNIIIRKGFRIIDLKGYNYILER